MFRLFLSITFCLLASGLVQTNAARIRDKTFSWEEPFIAHYITIDGNICKGSIIDARHVLTSGNCPNEGSVMVGQMSTFFGDGESNVQIAEVKESFTHPLYSAETGDYDFQILRLEEALTLNEFVQPVELDFSAVDHVAPGDIMWVHGMGSSNNRHVCFHELGKAPVRAIDHEKCKEDLAALGHPPPFVPVTDRMMCGFENTIDECYGSIGDPLMYNGYQVGLVSRTNYGESEVPYTVYSRLGSAMDWIQEVVEL